MLAFSAGIIFCASGFTLKVPPSVTIDGTQVGGLTFKAAAKVVRDKTESRLKGRRLVIKGKKCQYIFTFPEIYYKDDLPEVLKNARKGGEYRTQTRYYLCGAKEIAGAVAESESLAPVEPYFEFRKSGEPFVYFKGEDGRRASAEKIYNSIVASLSAGFSDNAAPDPSTENPQSSTANNPSADFAPVTVTFEAIRRKKTVEELKKGTRLIGSYTTFFDGENQNRSHNIRLAAELINGCILPAGGTFSFNGTVGKRTAERGFLSAKIIENGKFVEGVGGGVCQVSTTLYNAALLSGLEVTEFHAHSLAVGYVAPSRDAMVSGSACDLKFKNTSPAPVYIRAAANSGSVTFEIFGTPDGAKYYVESEITQIIPAPEVITDDPSAVRDGKDGLKSSGYLIIDCNGYKVKKLLRTDCYAPISSFVLP